MLENVQEFHTKYKQPIREALVLHDDGDSTDFLQQLAAALELLKTDSHDAAVESKLHRKDHRLWRMNLLIGELSELADALATRDEVAAADAMGDMDYALRGTALCYDIPLAEIHTEVHKSNMTKALELRPKGPLFVEPNIEAAIERGREKQAWSERLRNGTGI